MKKPVRRDLFPGALEIMILRMLKRQVSSFERMLEGITRVLAPGES